MPLEKPFINQQRSSSRKVLILHFQPYFDQIDALAAAWLPATDRQGVTGVLFGDYGFTGKLPSAWFKSFDQVPMHVGDRRYDPLFPSGFGITTEPVKRQ